jgi:hypothetical protein
MKASFAFIGLRLLSLALRTLQAGIDLFSAPEFRVANCAKGGQAHEIAGARNLARVDRRRYWLRRAIKRAREGPIRITIRSRPICIAITKGTSTGDEAAMIATASAPPGLVAR